MDIRIHEPHALHVVGTQDNTDTICGPNVKFPIKKKQKVVVSTFPNI